MSTMGSNLLIPNFENGEFLSETELYQLAWLPFDLYRLSNMARGHSGFFRPEAASGSPWNQFDHHDDTLTIRKLFVISPQGVPFIVTRSRTLALSEVTIDRTTLFASAYFAGSSRSLEDRHFLATLESDDGAPGDDEFDIPLFAEFDTLGDQGSERAPNAYQVLFHWGEESAPEIEGTRRFTLELGRLEGADGSAFTLSPTAYYPAAVPELTDATTLFRELVAIYSDLLLTPTLAPGVERSTLLDRLERLMRSLTTQNTPTREIVADVQLVLTSAAGFFLRIAYAQNPRDPEYRNVRGLEGRMLEHQLRSLFRGGRDDLSELIASFVAYPARTPETGQAQIAFFRGLETLFDVERTEAALGDLQAPPEPQRRPEPRPKPPPVEPIWVDLDNKETEGD